MTEQARMPKIVECKWCIENEPEWLEHAKVWVHRRDTVDKLCLNPGFHEWWRKTGREKIGGNTEEQIFNAGREYERAAIKKAKVSR